MGEGPLALSASRARSPGRAAPNNVRVGDRLSTLAPARTFATVIVRSLIATAALGLALAFAAPGHAAAAKDCGLTSRIDGVRYQVMIEKGKGKVTCSTVKRVASKYLRSFTAPKPWACFLGHGSQPYAASCGRDHPSVVVRVYAPG
jgi:hypothetical protein